MKFVEVSPIQAGIIQEWHSGSFELLLFKASHGRFQLKMTCHSVGLLPEFLVANLDDARLMARMLLSALFQLNQSSPANVSTILAAFAKAHEKDEVQDSNVKAPSARITTRVVRRLRSDTLQEIHGQISRRI